MCALKDLGYTARLVSPKYAYIGFGVRGLY